MAPSQDFNTQQPPPAAKDGRGRITIGEIRQQPELWATTIERVAASNARDIVQGRAAVICGAGTSAYASSAVAASWMNATAIPTTDLLLYSKQDLFRLVPAFVSNGVLVSIARSGDSPESVGVIKRIKQMFPGVAHLAITCNEKGEMLRLPGVNPLVLDPRTNDRSLVMTSSFSNLLLAGMLIAQPDALKQNLPAIAAAVNGAISEFDALGRKLADTVTQSRLLQGLSSTLGLPHPPKRIEVYDNSHIQGTNAVGAMIVAGPDGFMKNQYRKFNIKSEGLTPGDDYAMMQEVLQRRFKRLLNPPEGDAAKAKADDDSFPQWPDLVIIDGGRGQLNAVREIFTSLGLTQVSLLAVAKGPDRDAGR